MFAPHIALYPLGLRSATIRWDCPLGHASHGAKLSKVNKRLAILTPIHPTSLEGLELAQVNVGGGSVNISLVVGSVLIWLRKRRTFHSLVITY